MLKNVKFLYGIIAVLLAVCILCISHIAIDRKLMYEQRTRFVTTLSARTEGVYEWIVTLLDENAQDYRPDVSLASGKLYLEGIVEITDFISASPLYYNDLFTKKVYFGGASEFHHCLINVNIRFSEIQQNLDKNGSLSEEDREYLEKAETAFGKLFSKLETDDVINEQAIKNDLYLTYVCLDFIENME